MRDGMSDLGRDLFEMVTNMSLESVGRPPMFPPPQNIETRRMFARAKEETELILEKNPGLREGR